MLLIHALISGCFMADRLLFILRWLTFQLIEMTVVLDA